MLLILEMMPVDYLHWTALTQTLFWLFKSMVLLAISKEDLNVHDPQKIANNNGNSLVGPILMSKHGNAVFFYCFLVAAA